MDLLHAPAITAQLEVFETKDLCGLKPLPLSRGHSWEFIFMTIFVNIEFFCFKTTAINHIYSAAVLEPLPWVYTRVC